MQVGELADNAMASLDVEVGQIWLDKDKRMNERAVKVMAIKDGRVFYSPCSRDSSYVSSFRYYSSRLARFPKAFKRAA